MAKGMFGKAALGQDISFVPSFRFSKQCFAEFMYGMDKSIPDISFMELIFRQ